MGVSQRGRRGGRGDGGVGGEHKQGGGSLAAVLALLRANPGGHSEETPRVRLANVGQHLLRHGLMPTAGEKGGRKVKLSDWARHHPSLCVWLDRPKSTWWVWEAACGGGGTGQSGGADAPERFGMDFGAEADAEGEGTAAAEAMASIEAPEAPTLAYTLVTTVEAARAARAALTTASLWAMAVVEDLQNGDDVAGVAIVADNVGVYCLPMDLLAAEGVKGTPIWAVDGSGGRTVVVAHNVAALTACLPRPCGDSLVTTTILRDAQVGAELLGGPPFSSLRAVAAQAGVPPGWAPLQAGSDAWAAAAAAAAAQLVVAGGLAAKLITAGRLQEWEAASDGRAAAAVDVDPFQCRGHHPVAFDASRWGSLASPEVLAALGRPAVDTRVTVMGAAADLAVAIALLPARFRYKITPTPAEGAPGGKESTTTVSPAAPLIEANTRSAVAPPCNCGITSMESTTLPTALPADPYDLAADLRDLDLDVGSRPRASLASCPPLYLSDDPADLWTPADAEAFEAAVVAAGDGFGPDDRAGIGGCLHRVSRVPGPSGRGAGTGATLRIGRDVRGVAGQLTDLLGLGASGPCGGGGGDRGWRRPAPPSILLLGRPGCGKTTILRAVAAGLAATNLRVMVVDTSAEVGGASGGTHPALGAARRMIIPPSAADGGGREGKAGLGRTLLRALENHTPDVLVVDEVSAKADMEAVRSAKERKVVVIATAHGDVRSVLANEALRGALGGLITVTLGDSAAANLAAARRQVRAAVGPGGAGGDEGGACTHPSWGGGLHGDTREYDDGDWDAPPHPPAPATDPKTVTQRAGAPLFDYVVELADHDPHRCRIVGNVGAAVDWVLAGGTYAAVERVRHPATGDIFQKRGRY